MMASGWNKTRKESVMCTNGLDCTCPCHKNQPPCPKCEELKDKLREIIKWIDHNSEFQGNRYCVESEIVEQMLEEVV